MNAQTELRWITEESLLMHVEIVHSMRLHVWTFRMLDGTHDDTVTYLTQRDAEQAAIAYILRSRPDLIGTGELLV